MNIPSQPWYDDAAEAMVRHNVKLFEYANEKNLGLRKVECDNIVRTKEFMAALRAARNKFYRELANDPTRTRNTAVGQLVHAIQSLIDNAQFDKAVAAIAQLAKMEGWNKEAAQALNIFQDLSGGDISKLREKLEAKKKPQAVNPLPN